MLSLQLQNWLIIFVGNVHKISCLSFLLGSGREYPYVSESLPFNVSLLGISDTT
jgi:hypothetical protein